MEAVLDVTRVLWWVLLLPMVCLVSVGLTGVHRRRVAVGAVVYAVAIALVARAGTPRTTDYGGLIITEEGMSLAASTLTLVALAAICCGAALVGTGVIRRHPPAQRGESRVPG